MSDELPIKLLEPGACYSSGQTFAKCALNPAECELIGSGAMYRTSWQLSGQNEVCSRQENVRNIRAMGRCRASTDKKICSSDTSACQLSAGWQPLDPTCTLTEDLDAPTWDESYFGKCQIDGSDDFCAWSIDDCPEGFYRFIWANPFFANAVPNCRCDDVKTGACVSNTAPSTDFFCAASAEVCEKEPGFSYLKPMAVELTLGVTCKLCDEIPEPPEEKVVAAGFCADQSGSFLRCALIPAHCDGAYESFEPSSNILSSSITTPPEANICTTLDGVRNVRMGRCDAASNFRMCASDASACKLPVTFRPNDHQCSVSFDARPNNVIDGFSYFGFCSYNLDAWGIFHEDESVCVWSNRDCASSDPNAVAMGFYGSTPGISATKPECRCDMVRTGACVSSLDATDRHCAVQEDACGAGYVFVNWRDLDLGGNPLVCRLCSGLPDTAPANNAHLPPAPGPQSSLLQSPTDKGKGGLSGGVIAGIIVGVVALVILLLLAVLVLAKRRLPKDDPETKKEDKENEPEPSASSMEPGQIETDLVPLDDHSIN